LGDRQKITKGGCVDVEFVTKPELIWFVVAYLVMLISIGIYYSRNISSSDDFVLANKSLGSWVLTGTFLATFCGNGTIAGGGNSLAYNFGLWSGIFFAIPALCAIIVLFLLSEKIRNSGCYTVAELLEKTYGSTARTIAGVIIALAMTSIVAYQFRGLALVLNTTLGLSIEIGTVVGAFIIIFLAFSGGLKSVAYSDAVSAFIMFVGIILATPFVISAAGGWDRIVSTAAPQSLTFTGGQTAYGFLAAYFPLFFLTMGDQNLYQRIAASKSLKEMRTGLIGWFLGVLIIMPLVAVIAFSAKSYFGTSIKAGMAFMSTTTIIPTFLGGLLLAAATAFIITTGDSYLLSGATNLTYDIYAKKINPNATDKQKFIYTRWGIFGLGIIAYILMQFFPSILAIQFWSYTVYGAGITPALLGALIWSGVTKAGGLASMVCGAVTTIGWEAAGNPGGVASVLVAVPVSIVVLVAVSLMTEKQPAVAVK
jgi:Na+/proline symporter